MSLGRWKAAFPYGSGERFSVGTMSRDNRRRLVVFMGVFFVSALIGLAYSLMRPPEYRAAARLVITPGTDAANPRPVVVETQVLTSRPLVQRVLEDLHAREIVPELGPDDVSTAQSRLAVAPVANTNLVELSATGYRPEVLAPLLNGLIDVYRQTLSRNFHDSSADTLRKLREEALLQREMVEKKRAAVEEFRTTNNIVSTERDENDLLARVKGLGTSLSQASDKALAAEARLRALRRAAASGKTVLRASDTATLAELERRAAGLRERLRDWEQRFTPAYLRYDNEARAARTQLADTEQQIIATRSNGQQAALSEAEAELANARATASQLRNQAAGDRKVVGDFITTFNQYKAMQEDLTQFENTSRATQAKLMALEASAKARAPVLEVVEPASTPTKHFRPLYTRDAAISLGVATLLALFALWLVELFNRPDRQAETGFPQQWLPVGVDMSGRFRMAQMGSAPVETIEGRQAPLLAGQAIETRELSQPEVAQLLHASADRVRPLLILMLCGLSAEEVAKLRWDSVDFETRRLRVAGEFARELPMPEPSIRALRELQAASPSDFVADTGGARAMTVDELGTAVFCAAHDAELRQPMEVTPEALRHTFIVHVVRQGIRFSELGRLVGQLSAETLARYGGFAPTGQRRSADQIDLLLPGLSGA